MIDDLAIRNRISVLENQFRNKKDAAILLELCLLYDKLDQFVDSFKNFQILVENYPFFIKGKFFYTFFLIKWGRKEKVFNIIEDYFITKFFYNVSKAYYVNEVDISKFSYIFDKALENIELILKTNIEPYNLILKGWILYAKNLNYINFFEDLISKYKDNQNIVYLFSLLSIDALDYSRAIILLKKLIDLNPVFDMSYLLLGYVYLNQNLFSNAINYLKKASELNPKSSLAHLLLGKYLIILDKFDDAIEVLYKARDLEPNNPEIYYYLALAFKKQYEFDKSLKLLKNCIDFNYNITEVLKEMADIYVLKGDYKEAKKILEEILNYSIIEEPEVLEKLALVNERLNNLDSAIYYIDKALRIEPDNISFINLAALLAFKKGDIEYSYSLFKKLLSKEHINFDVYYYLGIIELSRFRFSLAKDYFEKALEMNPNKNEIKYFLALIYAFEGKLSNSIDILIKAKELIKDPYKNKLLSFNIASAFSLVGNISKTEQFLSEAIDDFIKSLRNVSEQDILFYTTLLFQTKVIIETSKLYNKLFETYNKLSNSTLQTLQAIVDIIESKDLFTKDHTKRVMIISTEIAKKMGIDDEFLKALIAGTVVHDIGKVGIPDNILNKPGKLTDEEFEIMKKHTIIGYNIVKQMYFPWPNVNDQKLLKKYGGIPECVRYHHEKWDGSGYPDGLKGEEIPILPRIIAVADVFDALMSKRQYKEGLPAYKSIEIIEKSKGKHFDPYIVDVFLEIADDLVLLLYAGTPIKELFEDKSVLEFFKEQTQNQHHDINLDELFKNI
ncbi:MAG: HD domain-containing phosphohydrolase [bacterium]